MSVARWLFGEPRPRDEVRAELEVVERLEALTGRDTFRGAMLRFELARQELVASIARALRS